MLDSFDRDDCVRAAIRQGYSPSIQIDAAEFRIRGEIFVVYGVDAYVTCEMSAHEWPQVSGAATYTQLALLGMIKQDPLRQTRKK